MAQTNFPKVFTSQEIATILQVEDADILTECEAGRIKAVKIGGKWRVTENSLRNFLGAVAQSDDAARATPPASEGVAVTWQPTSAFKHTWPNGDTESYASGFEADVNLPEGRTHFVVGYTNRKTVGMMRRRVVVFRGRISQLQPLVEFAGVNDHAKSQMVASVMKDRDNRHVKSVAEVPTEYSGIPTTLYSDVVVGPYAAHSIAVFVKEDERDTMLRHAIIRARYKGILK